LACIACRDIDLAVQQSLARDAELDATNPDYVAASDVPGVDNAVTLEEYEKKHGPV
jgi:hypothetical protein